MIKTLLSGSEKGKEELKMQVNNCTGAFSGDHFAFIMSA